MKGRIFYSKINQLYPSELGTDCFGLYNNLVRESNIRYSIKNEKFENLSKHTSNKDGFFGKRK